MLVKVKVMILIKIWKKYYVYEIILFGSSCNTFHFTSKNIIHPEKLSCEPLLSFNLSLMTRKIITIKTASYLMHFWLIHYTIDHTKSSILIQNTKILCLVNAKVFLQKQNKLPENFLSNYYFFYLLENNAYESYDSGVRV